MQNAIDEEGAFVNQSSNVFAFNKAAIELHITCVESVFKNGDNRLLSKCLAKTTLVEKKQRALEVGLVKDGHVIFSEESFAGACGEYFNSIFGNYHGVFPLC